MNKHKFRDLYLLSLLIHFKVAALRFKECWWLIIQFRNQYYKSEILPHHPHNVKTPLGTLKDVLPELVSVITLCFIITSTDTILLHTYVLSNLRVFSIKMDWI